MGEKTGQGMRRKIIQTSTALLCNGNLKGFLTGNLYQGKLKSVCVPGLNCYSCPGALGACPIGSLQALAGNSRYIISFYVLGFLGLVGLLVGRMACAFACPFGLVQELLFKIPSKKLPQHKLLRPATKTKYFVLFVIVFAIPMMLTLAGKVSVPTFCKYLCPAGTLQAGIPMVILNKPLQGVLGAIFGWKIFVLAVFLLWSVLRFRPFCRFFCPLGAIYSFFNKISIVHINQEPKACTGCKTCTKVCKMKAKSCDDLECIRCGECVAACPTKALKWTAGPCGKTLPMRHKKGGGFQQRQNLL